MIEPIPSKWMKNYLKTKNRELTDRETATLIWNVPNTYWSDRITALQELERITSDQLLKTQIQERVSFEIEEFEKFNNHSQEHIFTWWKMRIEKHMDTFLPMRLRTDIC